MYHNQDSDFYRRLKTNIAKIASGPFHFPSDRKHRQQSTVSKAPAVIRTLAESLSKKLNMVSLKILNPESGPNDKEQNVPISCHI